MPIKIQNKHSELWLEKLVKVKDLDSSISFEGIWTNDPSKAKVFETKKAAQEGLFSITLYPGQPMDLNHYNFVSVRKPKPTPLPAELWVMGYHFSTHLGSVCHIAHGEKFYATEEECQKAIDNMKSWIGMGDRSQYRPVMLVKAGE